MSRNTTGDARVTVCFRIDKDLLKLLDAMAKNYKQGRGQLMREAVQNWVQKQVDIRGIPKED